MTTICYSIAEKPGKFGQEFHNAGYKELGLDYTYTPLRVTADELNNFMLTQRNTFKGCSVSMPHKKEVMRYLDHLDSSAYSIRAVNTILNEQGSLIGFNTDYFGAKKSIESTLSIADEQVCMVGAGGVARAIARAVKDLGGNLALSNRNENIGKALAREVNAQYIPFDEFITFEGTLFINATSVGMGGSEDSILSPVGVGRYKAIMDVVVGDTPLLTEARAQGKVVIPGKKMTVYQASQQFEIYTKRSLPDSFIQKYLNG